MYCEWKVHIDNISYRIFVSFPTVAYSHFSSKRHAMFTYFMTFKQGSRIRCVQPNFGYGGVQSVSGNYKNGKVTKK